MVFRLRCPIRIWMVRRSVPDSSRCVAKLWRNECGETFLVIPARRTALIGSILPRWQPLPYVGRVDDIAQAALFLASDASRFVTGHNLVVDGAISAGWPIAAVRPDRSRHRRTDASASSESVAELS